MLSQINLKSIAGILFIILVAFLQITIMPYFAFGHAIGNLIFIFSIIFILKKEHLKSLLWILIGGFCLDLSFGVGFGIFIIPLVIISLVLLIFQERVFEISAYIFILGITFVASILFDFSMILMLYLYRQELSLFSLWPIILQQAVINTILMTIVHPLYYYFENKLYPERKIKLPESSI